MTSYQFYWDDETIEKLALFDLSTDEWRRSDAVRFGS